MPRKRNVLRRYEGANLVFFLGFILALGAFVFYIFNYYKTEDERLARAAQVDTGIQSEVVSSATNSCLFYLSDQIADSARTYLSARDVAAGDTSLVKDLFGISGVVQVVVDKKLVVVQKSPSSHWEIIQPSAREVIIDYILNKRGGAAKQ